MLHAVQCPIASGSETLTRPALRYALLRRLAASAASRGVNVLAFGLGEDELRMVLEGEEQLVANVVRGVKSGTCRQARSWGALLFWGPSETRLVTEPRLPVEIAWAHRAGPQAAPLASPWSSHRDLMGYRQADFVDAGALRRRVDPQEVHTRAGGGALPEAIEPEGPRSLHEILRVAAAVVGVLPADRRCFRLFVHVGRMLGWRTQALADALMLTERRIRQLAQGEESLLPIALAHLGDSRLAQVP